MKRHSLLTISLLAGASISQAAVSFTGTAINQTFTGFDGTAAPTGWEANGFSDGSGFTENRGSSSGGVSTGGTYAFDTGGGDIALGVQPGGSDFTTGYYQLEVTNDTGATLPGVQLGYTGYYLNNENRGNSMGLSYSTDGVTFTPIVGASYTSPAAEEPSASWVSALTYSGTLPVSVPDGGSFYLRFTGDDETGSGSRDEFAIDNVRFDAVPEPSSSLLGGLALLGLLRRRR